ncbi:hypothetical protein [Nocardiopsis oceani]
MERGRAIWLGVVGALVLVGLAACGADLADGAYYRLHAVPLGLLPLAWTLSAVLFLVFVAVQAPRDAKAALSGVGCLALVLALLTGPYTMVRGMTAESRAERHRVEIEGYALVAEARGGPGASLPSAPECALYLRQDGGPFSREVALTEPGDCPVFRVSDDGAGFVFFSSEGGAEREIDPADHF